MPDYISQMDEIYAATLDAEATTEQRLDVAETMGHVLARAERALTRKDLSGEMRMRLGKLKRMAEDEIENALGERDVLVHWTAMREMLTVF